MASPPSASSRSEAEEVLESIRLKGIKRVTAEYVRNARQSRVPKTQEGHIPRPMNAFILFTTISPEHETLQYYPRRKELLRHLGDIWRSTDWKRRKPYQDVATELTNEHKRLYPNYMFKPRPRKKSNVPKSPTGKDPGAALQPISTDPKVGCKFSMPNTMEDGQKIQNNVHSWDPYGPPPQNLLEYARVPARCLVEAGSSRSTPGDVSTTRTLDTVREETLGNEFLYQFHETLQSPQQACYETSPADLTSPTSPSNDGSSDELRTPSTQSTLQINPQTRPFNEFRISQTLGKVHCAANSTPSRVLKPSDLQAATSPPDNDLVEYLDDYKTHNSGNAYQDR
ncbi:uncharacterized protein EI90DRAFT_2241433 [Cantharellus anzutake]|uniref:uncharacterized protein n=1 Tax=Cantharellus anzutake TaxID=1750568 RepID=UPI001905A287|nr:uncharacterized protein EI90DRAFT_2241433 [Cantharellus anzutake]KAF8324702.1 hypothetical protein EI90DRAFT_2241433 [Cantharellus anzutake]